MVVVVLVHGAYAGGWRGAVSRWSCAGPGNAVFTPTLSGLGDRAHVATADPITLSTHVRDVVRLLEVEDLHDVVLVGWSYGGAVVSGVADLVPERLSRVVNLDGEVVQEGLSRTAGWTDELRELMGEGLVEAERTGWLRAPTTDEHAGMIDDETARARVGARERPQPFGTYTQPYPDTGGRRFTVPHTYVRFPVGWEEEPVVTALRTDPRWEFVEVPVNHLAVFHSPDVVAAALLAVVAGGGGG